MLNCGLTKLFGSRRRTEVLIMVALLEETYPTELARLLGAPLYSVQKVVDALDREGVLATRLIGNERRVTLSPRFFARTELRELLQRLAEAEPELREAATKLRRRPRRKGKSL
jgi:DNA-binding MarR family transcriptional regulator